MEKLKEDPQDFGTGHKVISPNVIMNKDRDQIKQLLMQLSQEYNVSVKDIAFALANVLRRVATTDI